MGKSDKSEKPNCWCGKPKKPGIPLCEEHDAMLTSGLTGIASVVMKNADKK